MAGCERVKEEEEERGIKGGRSLEEKDLRWGVGGVGFRRDSLLLESLLLAPKLHQTGRIKTEINDFHANEVYDAFLYNIHLHFSIGYRINILSSSEKCHFLK